MNFATFTVFICILTLGYAWDSEEMEIFDLVEDINENFYTMLGVQQDASLSEIKKAFRNLSVVMHPDKSDSKDANVKFRNLVFVYEVLKDSSKREKYDLVLKNGLPNWKSALYYYRRARRMGLAEMGALLFAILTVGQYIIAWAAYAEKKYTAESIIGSKLKKMQKKSKTNINMDTILNTIPSPSIMDTLPFQIPRAIWNIPKYIKSFFDIYAEYRNQQIEIKEQEAREIEQLKLIEEKLIREKEAKKEGLRKRKEKFAVKEKTNEELEGYSKYSAKPGSRSSIKSVSAKESQSGGFWTDEDLTELVRLVKKYPGGTPARWEVIAEMMNRTVHEITFMAGKMKENGYRVPGQSDSVAESIVQEETKKLKTKRNENQILVLETNWSQEQQQLLELAIVKYPKGSAGDRWIKIANSVPGKTKEECLARYKHLVEIVKAQRSRENKTIDSPESTTNDVTDAETYEDINKTDDDKIEAESQYAQNDEIGAVKPKGKPRNRRKEKKNVMDFSSDDE